MAYGHEEVGVTAPRRMLLNAFHMNCVSHIQQGLWVRDDTRQLEYTQFEPWVALARILEKGCFDALFLADVMGLYDTYRGSAATSIIEAMQVPVNDPALLIPAMAYVTEHLGFAFTSSVLQTHPFTFARQLSTLDHLTRGRVAWNIITSYLPNAAASLGYGGLPPHEARYDRADEYLDVTYKLWEVVGRTAQRVQHRMYADPAKIHPIHHVGTHYAVVGPHLSEPSPQRTPAVPGGSSPRGRAFAAKHAECVFIVTSRQSLRGASSIIHDIAPRQSAWDATPRISASFRVSPVVGGTEAEAGEKAAYLAQFSTEGALAIWAEYGPGDHRPGLPAGIVCL